jgi:glycosyltransferase involved in cell wall biosynthesis
MDVRSLDVWIVGGSSWGNGGVERYCERLASMLDKQGFKIIRRFYLDSAVLTANGRLRACWKFMTTLCRVSRAYRTAVAGKRIPFVWLQYGNVLDLLTLIALAFFSRERLICTVHASETWRHLRSKTGRFLTYFALRLPARVCVLADFQAEELLAAGLRNVERIPTLLPNWINEEQPSSRVGKSTILFVGRVSRRKGAADLLYVAKRLSDRGASFLLEVVGRIEDESHWDMRHEIARLGLQTVVRLVGELDEDGVLAHLRSSSILLYPSYVDTYPLVILEASASGLHVIAYDLKGAEEILREFGSGRVVPLGDREALSRAVIAALDGTQPLPPNELEVRNRLSWDVVARDYLRCMVGVHRVGTVNAI